MPIDVNVEYRELQISDCKPDLLESFNRYQEVKRCWRKENGEWVLKDIPFIEHWDAANKARKVMCFIQCMEQGGCVTGAFTGSRLVGFATIESGLFGSSGQYIQLGSFHVSNELRNMGIGKKLFALACENARKLGAARLYISANSSEETQAFYRAVGCTDAEEINQALAEKEPCDCQMEYKL